LAAANLPSPKQSKSLAVPSDDGLRRLRPGEKADEVLTDSYTGIGEVVGVHQTGLLLARLNRPIQVKRARLLSLDDVQDRDVIFIGGTAENLDLRKILPASAIRIYNEGTTPAAAAAAPGGIQQLDEPINAYTVVTLTHGVRPQHWILVLADSSTLGTQAAVEFVCRPETVTKLLTRLGQDGVKKSFRCNLKSRIVKGVPVETVIVAVKRLDHDGPAETPKTP
jgi:hypothetical protein